MNELHAYYRKDLIAKFHREYQEVSDMAKKGITSEEIRQKYEAGATKKELAVIYNVGIPTIDYHLRKTRTEETVQKDRVGRRKNKVTVKKPKPGNAPAKLPEKKTKLLFHGQGLLIIQMPVLNSGEIPQELAGKLHEAIEKVTSIYIGGKRG